MKSKKEKSFDSLLEKRQKLSKKMNKKQKVSACDSQLSDIINNFNESNQYKRKA